MRRYERIRMLRARIAKGKTVAGDIAVLAQLEGDRNRAAIDPRPCSTGAENVGRRGGAWVHTEDDPTIRKHRKAER